jgi:hypothetical protein
MAVDWDESTSYYPNAQGNFSRSESNCETDNLTAKVDDMVTHIDASTGITRTLPIKNIKDGEQTLSGTVLTRIFQF